MFFPVTYEKILERIDRINPILYGKTRNFSDGALSYLSPYISRGVITTRQVMQSVIKKDYPWDGIEKFLQELAWRDYWQQLWVTHGRRIDEDLTRPQEKVVHHGIPRSLIEARTGIKAIDEAVTDFYKTGYLHNHMRMYLASLACNIGGSHWKVPARWMYYHLLDADWASNALSWQWVAGTNSHKKYYANQNNINRYFYTSQEKTFLDTSYDRLSDLEIPDELLEIIYPELITSLPSSKEHKIDNNLPTYVYNFYNLDPEWGIAKPANRILLLEPSHFKEYPVSGKTVGFVIKLSENIPGIQVYTGEFTDLVNQFNLIDIHYKEHPLNRHYTGTEHSREWMFPVKGSYPSFFSFWKKCMNENL
jgi:deoxyribodipyrimidine photo-lyase